MTNQPKQPRHIGNSICIEALAMMHDGDITARDLAARVDTELETCRQWLAAMAHVRLAHVVEWRLPTSGKGGTPHPVYRLGNGESVMRPRGAHRRRRLFLGNVPSLALLWDELQFPSTRGELVEASGFSPGTVRKLVKHMQRLRIIRVCGYAQRPAGVSGLQTEQLQRGRGPDAKRPAPKPNLECVLAYQKRRKDAVASGAMLGSVWAQAMAA